MKEKLYHVVVINNKTGQETIMTAYPEPHEIACILLSKLTKYKWRKETLKDVDNITNYRYSGAYQLRGLSC